MSKITFSQEVKNEITSEVDFSKERREALLSAFIRINGVLVFKKGNTNVKLKTYNSKIAKYVYQHLKDYFPDDDIRLSFDKKKNKKTLYIIDINDADKLLDTLNVDYFEGKISKEIVYNDETIAGYIAGAFLASGSINSPETPNYHLEIVSHSDNYAKWLAKLFGKYKKIELSIKLIKRREKYVLYMKRSDQIANFLAMVGAPETCITFEDERVSRDFMNSNNRLENFELSNVKKASVVGKRQAKEIKFIDDVLGIHNLHNQKKELLCYLRLENKEATLSELAALLSEEIGEEVSKSNVNHLFRDLHELYIKIQGVKK